MPEPVFVLPTDGASMLCVKSTSKGRIFMGGKDGCLYEITYQVKKKFSKLGNSHIIRSYQVVSRTECCVNITRLYIKL